MKKIVGYLPHLIYNRKCIVGNTDGLPEIWKNNITFINDTLTNAEITFPEYYWKNNTCVYKHEYVSDEYKKIIYQLFPVDSEEYIVYTPALTDADNLQAVAEGMCPNYNSPLAIYDDNNDNFTDDSGNIITT